MRRSSGHCSQASHFLLPRIRRSMHIISVAGALRQYEFACYNRVAT